MADASNPSFEFLEQRFDVTNEEIYEYSTKLEAIKTSEATNDNSYNVNDNVNLDDDEIKQL